MWCSSAFHPLDIDLKRKLTILGALPADAEIGQAILGVADQSDQLDGSIRVEACWRVAPISAGERISTAGG